MSKGETFWVIFKHCEIRSAIYWYETWVALSHAAKLPIYELFSIFRVFYMFWFAKVHPFNSWLSSKLAPFCKQHKDDFPQFFQARLACNFSKWVGCDFLGDFQTLWVFLDVIKSVIGHFCDDFKNLSITGISMNLVARKTPFLVKWL